MYTLRNVMLSGIKEPIGNQVVPETLEFDLGYYPGKGRKWINNQDDAMDVLKTLNKLTQWCTGILEKEKERP